MSNATRRITPSVGNDEPPEEPVVELEGGVGPNVATSLTGPFTVTFGDWDVPE
jgi:hypothetical protein